MLFSTMAAVAALVPASLASPTLIPRDVNTVVADIGNINGSIVTLNNTLNTFKPDDVLGVAKALQIQKQTETLGDIITQTTSDTQASQPFDQDQSNTVAVAVVGLGPQIQSLLANIVAHKPAFASAFLIVGDLSKTVRADLVKQSNATTLLGNAITQKLSSPYSDLAPLVTAQIQGYFNDAIAKYDSCLGVLCLPDVSGFVKA